jgi:HAD superfamily hydrolase (TIGR01509 family)
VPWQPGARALLKSVRDAGVPTALVTMSVRSMAEDIVAAIPFEAFDLLVTGDEVAEPKPHPEPYLTAAEQLGVAIADCVAIEDSVPGLRSAASAGTIAIGVPHMVPLDPSAAHVIWESLDGRSVDDIVRVVASARERA